MISDFTEDADVTTTTVPGGHIQAENLSIWREGRIPYRQGDRGYNGVFLGWNREGDHVPVYSIALPDGQAGKWQLGQNSVLTLSLAVTDEKAPLPGKTLEDDKKSDKDDKNKKPETTDFTVELQTTDGATARIPLSRFGALLPPFKARFTKFQFMDDAAYEKSSEPIFQTIDLPLSAFSEQTKGFDPAKIKTIRLRFDRTQTRVVILSEVGFGSGF